ncbi:glycosyltransferase [uncultured Pontibacter sp.]|uniref:glycosyltransferase n=1 Tax=uncultured Pontibacter sp. TaxID=453356 RepID=UPI0026203437|nr:glycosyltransferase [uncultured Pontibacter sp.]
MKILQLIQKPQPRGAEVFTAQLSSNLENLQHSSHILALFDSPDSSRFISKCQLLNANSKARFWDKDGWAKLATIIKELKPDVIQANAGDTLKYAVFSKLFFKWKQPIVFRNASTLSSYIKNPLQKLYNEFLYKQTDAIASVSEYSRNDLLLLYPGLKSRTYTIPIGLEEKIRVENPFPVNHKDQVKLVHVGGFSFEKNHTRLLHIFSALLATQEHVHLWLVGDGPLRMSIENQVKDMGLQNNVHFTGFVNNPLDYIANAQVLVLPSIIEGLPGVILEAMLYETPVVAYNVGGIREIVKSNETGWLIEPGDEKGFAKALEDIILMKEADKYKIIQKAEKLVKGEYMNVHIATKFAFLYKQLLNKN